MRCDLQNSCTVGSQDNHFALENVGRTNISLLRKPKFVTVFTKSQHRIQYQCCAITHVDYLALLLQIKKVKQSRYRHGVAQRVPGS